MHAQLGRAPLRAVRQLVERSRRSALAQRGGSSRSASVVARASSTRPRLITAPGSRGQMCMWYIKELGLDAEIDVQEIDIVDKKEHKSEEFLQINPFGIWPALVDGDLKLYESGAILLYLADKSGKLPTIHDRAVAAKWLFFANSTLATGLFVEAMRYEQAPRLLKALDKILDGSEFIEGGEFSVSDVAVGSFLLLAKAMIAQIKFAKYPNVQGYMRRLAARPAARAAMPAIVAAVDEARQ